MNVSETKKISLRGVPQDFWKNLEKAGYSKLQSASATQIKSFFDETFFIRKSNIRSKKLQSGFFLNFVFDFLRHFEDCVYPFFMVFGCHAYFKVL